MLVAKLKTDLIGKEKMLQGITNLASFVYFLALYLVIP